MRRRRSRLGALLIVLFVAGSPAWAQDGDQVEEGGAAFLLIPVGARSAALGQAAIADYGTSEAAFWNPAGLALIPETELALHFASTFASNNTAITAQFPTRRLGVLGVSGYLVDFGSQEVVVGPGAPTGRISVKNIELLASWATELLGNLALGVNYKLIQFRQDCSGDCGTIRTVVGTTHGVDIGAQYAFGTSENLRVGMAVRHAGFKLQLENRDQADPLPTRVQIGFAWRIYLPQPKDATQRLDARILFDLQDAWGQYDSPDARLGLELGYGQAIRLRAGYAFLHSESRGPSIGAGLRFGRIALDIARIFFSSSNLDEPFYASLRAIL
jgi:hypothetical protein